jgi:hypothetical protein
MKLQTLFLPLVTAFALAMPAASCDPAVDPTGGTATPAPSDATSPSPFDVLRSIVPRDDDSSEEPPAGEPPSGEEPSDDPARPGDDPFGWLPGAFGCPDGGDITVTISLLGGITIEFKDCVSDGITLNGVIDVSVEYDAEGNLVITQKGTIKYTGRIEGECEIDLVQVITAEGWSVKGTICGVEYSASGTWGPGDCPDDPSERPTRPPCGGDPGDPGDCDCPLTFRYAPVCDPVTGITYESACHAECAGVREYVDGPCDPLGTGCDRCAELGYDPVCGSDGKSYDNACYAVCAGIYDYKPGLCDDWCGCTEEYAPVCDPSTGTTYSNACFALCAGVTTWVDGECDRGDDDCICTGEYAPVCDPYTGITYSNACHALCAGVTTWVDGECDRGGDDGTGDPSGGGDGSGGDDRSGGGTGTTDPTRG